MQLSLQSLTETSFEKYFSWLVGEFTVLQACSACTTQYQITLEKWYSWRRLLRYIHTASLSSISKCKQNIGVNFVNCCCYRKSLQCNQNIPGNIHTNSINCSVKFFQHLLPFSLSFRKSKAVFSSGVYALLGRCQIDVFQFVKNFLLRDWPRDRFFFLFSSLWSWTAKRSRSWNERPWSPTLPTCPSLPEKLPFTQVCFDF